MKYLLKFKIAFLDPLNKKTSRMQRTLITRKNWICDYYHINWMNSKKSSSRPEVFCKKSVLKNFTKFTEEHLRPATLLKKRLWYRCFPLSLAKFLRIPFFIKHLCWIHSRTATTAFYLL